MFPAKYCRHAISKFSNSFETINPKFLFLAELLFSNTHVKNKSYLEKSEFGPFLTGSALQKFKKIYELSKTFSNLEDLLKSEINLDMKELYKNELDDLRQEITNNDDQIVESFFDFKNANIDEALVEIRAGVGGAEAALFAGELADLYKLYFQYKGCKYFVVSESSVGAHTKEIILSIDAKLYGKFYGETGVHRVQRVPETESQGRIHTSTVSVAVIPKYFHSNELFNEKDIRMDVYRSSGPGGQNVNKTNSAVRLVHVPTGITVCMQDERSQVENRIKAYKVLKIRLEELNRNIENRTTKAVRELQIGKGDRADKIRTYNFPQNRVSDHRFTNSSQSLSLFFKDPSVLDDFIKKQQHNSLTSSLDKLVETIKITR